MQKKGYDNEFKVQAVKLSREIGFSKASKELGINADTLYGWNKRAKDTQLDLGRFRDRNSYARYRYESYGEVATQTTKPCKKRRISA